MFLYQITITNVEKVAKGRYNVIYIYKLQLSEHHHKGYINSPFYPDLAKCIQLLVHPNFKSLQESKMLK